MLILLSVLFTALFYSIITRRHSREEKRIETGKELIRSFDDTIKSINAYEGQFYLLEQILRHEFKGQRIAARGFMRHLNKRDRACFNRAWNKYHDSNENHPGFRQYIMINDPQELLLSRIKNMLKFAET